MGEKGLKLDLTPGTEYKNRNGNSYKCVSLLEDKRGSAVMRRVSDGYVLTAHGVREHEDGLIEWDYQSNGHWGKYWSRDGRFEEDLERMESQMPDIGFTGNGYTDALIIACKLYYDAYNNGGCNIDEHYLTEAKRILTPLMPSFNISAFINCEPFPKKRTEKCEKKWSEKYRNQAAEEKRLASKRSGESQPRPECGRREL